MNLRIRYKSSRKKRITRFVMFYSFLSFVLLFYSSFARYATTTEDAPTIEVANWKIQVNGNSISNSETLTNIVTLVPNGESKTTDNKLAPGQTGYFDIVINPEGTDVAIEYSITIDTTNLPTGVVLTTYEIVEDGISESLDSGYSITRNN